MAAVSLFGLGYVGSVVTACLAERGHRAIEVDADPMKTELVATGFTPIEEDRLEKVSRRGVAKKLVQTTTNPQLAVSETDISLVCVGSQATPTAVRISHMSVR